MSAGSGPSLPAWWAKYDPASCSWKTPQVSLLSEWDESLETFPPSGTMLSGKLYPRHPLAPRTSVTGSGSWPTPSAANPNDGESLETWEARREALKAKGINGNGCGMPLGIAVRLWPTPNVPNGGRKPAAGKLSPTGETADGKKRQVDPAEAVRQSLWPTPTVNDSRNGANRTARRTDPGSKHHDGLTLVDATRLWPTPQARDWKSSHASEQTLNGNSRPLNEVAASGSGGQLSATFVEWLIGVPKGWTEI